ncbi:hypothetical protein TPHA_0L02060 [Tetrapisispora phaffii CBS 4417]|uniref:IPT/TIG domain-containing protein n=1 Tax=Tetrapisispora phaffii (strain ATCC 24235 / CBS 4417 / NBRC 1672 / NRRL Y-8282 / UCD 70-5) TaxID=1071381 RepID=G8C080_TETPH|nr:hypothetical protein TPHA_0L02060 [Tetrapisispora phaffii CBS 4417]CCE65558.1 hypothetical protein TPHA_0L02060 [Tetrapisispora phaffii CBS 4417]
MAEVNRESGNPIVRKNEIFDVLDEFLYPNSSPSNSKGNKFNNNNNIMKSNVNDFDEEIFNAFIKTDSLDFRQHDDHNDYRDVTKVKAEADAGTGVTLDQYNDTKVYEHGYSLNAENHSFMATNGDEKQDDDGITTTTTMDNDGTHKKTKSSITNTQNIYEILIENTVSFGERDVSVSSNLDSHDTLASLKNAEEKLNKINELVNMDENLLPNKLIISKLPHQCRVENQINISIQIEPPLTKQHILHLSSNNVAKNKLFLSKDIDNYPKNFLDEIVFLESFLLCSETNKIANVCPMCINREQRRASRRKSGLCDNILWCQNENRSALIFNSKQILPISSVAKHLQAFKLTARMVCYSRHHKSSKGFKILFILKNLHGDLLAKSISDSILIMDKKPSSSMNGESNKNKSATSSNFKTNASLSPSNDKKNKHSKTYSNSNTDLSMDIDSNMDTDAYYSTNLSEASTNYASMSDAQYNTNQIVQPYTHNTSLPNVNDPNAMMLPSQNNEYDSNNHNGNSMFNFTSPQTHIPSHNRVPSQSQLPPQLNSQQQLLMLNSFMQQSGMPIIPSPTSMSEDGLDQNKSRSIKTASSTQIAARRNEYINGSARPKRQRSDIADTKYHSDNMNHSPLSWINNSNNSNNNQFNQTLQNNANQPVNAAAFTNRTTDNNMPMVNTVSQNSNDNNIKMNLPLIQRAIPSQGPITGGIEITLLGSNFRNGLTIKFGDNVTLSTQCWSDSTMVTYLPPAATAGQVFIIAEDPKYPNQFVNQSNSNKNAVFTYLDDTDRQLIELALQIVGLKMNGKLEDARNIAKRIVGNDENSPNISPANGSAASTGNSNYSKYSSQLEGSYSDEQLIVKVINSLNATSNLSMCDSNGRTLLHLAALKGYEQLVMTLIKYGARIDEKDMFGYTPLHFACVNGEYKIIAFLLKCKADLTIKAKNGVHARDVYMVNHGNDEISSDDYNRVIKMFDSLEKGSKLEFNNSSSGDFDLDSLHSLEYDIEPSITVNSRGKTHKGPTTVAVSVSEDSGYEVSDGESFITNDSDLSSMNSESRDFINTENNGNNVFNIERSTSKKLREANELEENTEITNDESKGTETENNSVNYADRNNDSLWNRMLNRINDDLPKYEDLFPGFTHPSKAKQQTTSMMDEEQAVTMNKTKDMSVLSSNTDDLSQTSSEDEDDAIQIRLNRFFQQQRETTFQNDKMLWFFWFPLSIILISTYFFIKFGSIDDSKLYSFSFEIVDRFRKSLAKLMLGNDRMKAAFKEQLSNFQNTGIHVPVM